MDTRTIDMKKRTMHCEHDAIKNKQLAVCILCNDVCIQTFFWTISSSLPLL